MPAHSYHGTSCGCDADEHQMLEGTLDFLFEKASGLIYIPCGQKPRRAWDLTALDADR